MEQFWQNFPKAIEAEAGVGELSLRIFPIQFADVHEIQGGEQKTHIFHVGFGNDLGVFGPHGVVPSPPPGSGQPRLVRLHRRDPLPRPGLGRPQRSLQEAGRRRDRRPRHLRVEARGRRRIRLAALRRRLRRSRGGLPRRPHPPGLALQRPVRQRRRLRSPVPPERRPSVVGRDVRAGDARRRRRHLSHGPRTNRPTTTAYSGTPATTSTPTWRTTGPIPGPRRSAGAALRVATTTRRA